MGVRPGKHKEYDKETKMTEKEEVLKRNKREVKEKEEEECRMSSRVAM